MDGTNDVDLASANGSNTSTAITSVEPLYKELHEKSPLAPTKNPSEDPIIKPMPNVQEIDNDNNESEGNLLEESSYIPDDDLEILDQQKRKIGDSEREKSFKKAKNIDYYDEEDEFGEEEDDDDFDEDDEEEFEMERQQMAEFGDSTQDYAKDYESDVDSLGDFSDQKSENDKSLSDPNESININDILNQSINLDKTVQLSDIVENPDELTKQIDAEKDDQEQDDVEDDEEIEDGKEEDETDIDFDISEKLKDMGEISVKPVSKSELNSKKEYDLSDEVSVEITKKGSTDTEDKRKISNLRKNIREVMDDTQLDASTLAAQREELERLARVQEQQRIIREVQRQIALERQNSKTQNRVLSLLQGHTSLLKASSSTGASSSKFQLPGSSGTTLMKLPPGDTKQKGATYTDASKFNRASLTPSVSIAPVKPPNLKKDEPSEEKPPDDVATKAKAKKDVVTIVDSSDDDCIVLSDDDEVPEEEDDPQNSGLHVNDAYNIPDDQGRVVINIGHPEGDQDIFLAPQIARIIKPHQIGGVRFLFDNIIESVERFNTSTGFGCILAHSMGLGKTLQLVCFCDIFLRHTSSKTILCIMPINTLQNWMAEFNMWLPEDAEKSALRAHGEVRPRHFKLFVLNDTHKTLSARSKVVLDWAKEGGVLLIGYELYRLLSLKKVTKKRGRKVIRDPELEKEEAEEHRKLLDEMHAALVKPGPDLIVCDEGHRIKNSHASISVALKQIRSKRRIVLTGYPLQNNLLEYWCMVDFVRPNYLGTKTEFSNMFERPIQNGQCIDSTPQDIKLMRYRAHVLHSLLLGFVQRRSHVVLQNSLPQKEEYVILVRMTPFQRKLYEVFMNEVVRTKAVPNPLKAFAVCCKIWNHPDVLYNFLKKREADLDLEEAEAAAANDPTYEPPPPKPIKGSKKKDKMEKTPSPPKEKKPRKNARADSNKSRSKKAKEKPAATIPPNSADTQIKVEKNEIKIEANADNSQEQKPAMCGENIKKEGDNGCVAVSSNSGNIKKEPGDSQTYPAPTQDPYGYNYGSGYNMYNNYDPNYYQNYGNYPTQSSQSSQDTHYYQNQNYGNFPDSYINQNSYPPTSNQYPPSTNVSNQYTPSSSNSSQFMTTQNQYLPPTSTSTANQYPPVSTTQSSSNQYSTSTTQQYPAVSAAQSSSNQYSPSTTQQYPPVSVAQSSSSQYLTSTTPANQYQPVGPPPPTSQPPPANYWPNNPQSPYYPHEYNSNSGYQNYGSNDYNSSTNYQQPSFPTPATPVYPSNSSDWNSTPNGDVKPFDETKASQIVDLDTKEIKTEMPLTMNLDIAKIEEKPKVEEIKDEPVAIEKDVKPKDDSIPYDWAIELMKNYIPDLIENSPKMEIFFCILEESMKLGDRMLVFSQSLLTLNLIEKFLQVNDVPGTENKWAKNTNYYRLDGSTAALEREKLINEFNSNPNIHLFLVSTRAGSLGINLVGANRVVVFDASWNPCHDTQAVCRVYRYGQKKPCFVYRIVMDSCLEKKIYDRQVNKQGMSDRVVDECNPDARLSLKEVTNLCWDDEAEAEIRDFSESKEKYMDIVVQKVIEQHWKLMTKEPFQHESLLIDRKEKKLSLAEKRLAQRGYELEKQAASRPNYLIDRPHHGTNYRTIRTPDGSIVHRPVASVRPMQAEIGGDRLRTGMARPTRWIPAEVWQRQGMTAQVLTLPGDVVIPTSSAEKSNIVLKEGQKVMVLKSPKGIYMQLETGKIIAIRTAFKMGQAKDKPPSGLIGREFQKRPNPMRPLGPNPSADLPPNLKNNSAISVIPNKPGRPTGTFNRGGGYGPHNATGVRPISLLNKPRPNMQSLIKNRMHPNITNKNVQLGTARPYNLKQGQRMPTAKTMMRPTQFSTEIYDGESSNDGKIFERKTVTACIDIKDASNNVIGIKKITSTTEELKSKGVEVLSQEIIRKADEDKDDTASGNSNDDVIMVSSDDKPVLPKSQAEPYSYYNYSNNPTFYSQNNYQPRQPYPYFNQQQNYYNQYPPQQHHGQGMQPPHDAYIHSAPVQNFEYPASTPPTSSQASNPHQASNTQPPIHSVQSSPSKAPLNSATATITIDDDTDQPVREKLTYKSVLTDRKVKATPKKIIEDVKEPLIPPQSHAPKSALKNYRHKTSKVPTATDDSLESDHSRSSAETSLSYLERTTSSIDENQSVFNASLTDITKSPASGPGNDSVMNQTIQAKPKPRPRPRPRPTKSAISKTPSEPKIQKEKARPAKKSTAKPTAGSATTAPYPSPSSESGTAEKITLENSSMSNQSSQQEQNQLPVATHQQHNVPQISQQHGYQNYPQSYGGYPPPPDQHASYHNQPYAPYGYSQYPPHPTPPANTPYAQPPYDPNYTYHKPDEGQPVYSNLQPPPPPVNTQPNPEPPNQSYNQQSQAVHNQHSQPVYPPPPAQQPPPPLQSSGYAASPGPTNPPSSYQTYNYSNYPPPPHPQTGYNYPPGPTPAPYSNALPYGGPPGTNQPYPPPPPPPGQQYPPPPAGTSTAPQPPPLDQQQYGVYPPNYNYPPYNPPSGQWQ